ncbi:MAG: polysaccharide pyruvyl transferase family protein [Acidothermaceae bacterium]
MTDKSAMRVLLANHWHDDNRGDSAITQGILTLLRERWPAADVTITTLAEDGELWRGCGRHLHGAFDDLTITPSPAPTELRGHAGRRSTAKVATDTALLWLRTAPSFLSIAFGRPLRSWKKRVIDHDLVVLVGGSNIFDDAGVPAALGIPRLIGVLGAAYTAIRVGRPVLLLGHTLGPFDHWLGRRIAARMLRGTDLAVVREAGSISVAEQLGVRRVEEAPDMAFALTPARTPRVAQMLRQLPADPSRTLVLSVRQHPTHTGTHDDRLVVEFADAARQLIADGDVDGVAVVAHTTGPTPIEDDRPVSVLLAKALHDVPVTLIDDDATPAELSAFYGEMAAVVAVRLHAAILALNAGTPTFAVSYLTAKTQGVMTQVGLPDAVAEFRTVSARQIAQGVRRLLASSELQAGLTSRALERRIEMVEAAARWFDVSDPAASSSAAGQLAEQARRTGAGR